MVDDICVCGLVLADTATSVQRFVSVFVGVYVLLILGYIITSWFPPGASSTVERIRQRLVARILLLGQAEVDERAMPCVA